MAMRNRQKRVMKPRFWGTLIVLTVLIVAGGRIVTNRYTAQANVALNVLKERYVCLADEIENLEENIEFAQTEDYVERMAREQLGLLRPGEIRYVTHQP